MAKIVDYTGGLPGGRNAPDLSTVPINDSFDFYFALAFARDLNRDGVFQPDWDQAITPGVIAQLKQGNGSRKFLASLGGGDNFPWQDPSDVGNWVSAATSSLSSLMDTYGLDGIDIDYENGLDDSFVQAIGQVVTNLKQQKNAFITITPFGQTWPAYQSLYQGNSASIDLINYQAYADGLDEQGYLNLYENLAQVTGTYANLMLGIASSTQAPRGMQPPQIYDVWHSLQGNGIGGAIIWCLEDSKGSDPPYIIETNVENGAPTWHWQQDTLTANIGAPQAASAPFAYVTPDGTARVIYQDSNNNITEIYLAPKG
jgi:hypothetical protein